LKDKIKRNWKWRRRKRKCDRRKVEGFGRLCPAGVLTGRGSGGGGGGGEV